GTRLELALHVNGAPLREVLGAVLGLVAPHRHAVPLGPLLPLPALVLEDLGRGDAQVAEGATRRRVLELRIRPQVSNQDHLVDASHLRSLLAWSSVTEVPELRARCYVRGVRRLAPAIALLLCASAAMPARASAPAKPGGAKQSDAKPSGAKPSG